MKRIILTLVVLCVFMSIKAQISKDTTKDPPTDSIALQEVEVKAARVVNRVDGKTFIPSQVQKDHSPTGYSLLGKLALPNIRIDEALRSITALDNKGEVQVRINGAKAKLQDIQTLDVKNVSRIDFIDNPGVRYGTDIGYVIDIRTRRTSAGYSLGADLTNALTTVQGANDIFASYNKGKSQLHFYYENNYHDYKGQRQVEDADYLLEDGSLYHIQRQTTKDRSREFAHVAELKYSIADTTPWLFQASLSGAFSNEPRTFSEQMVTETGKQPYATAQSEKSRSMSPVLDLYFFRQ